MRCEIRHGGIVYGDEAFPYLFAYDHTTIFLLNQEEINTLHAGQGVGFRWSQIRGGLETAGPQDKFSIHPLSEHRQYIDWKYGLTQDEPTYPILEADLLGVDLYLYIDPDNPDSFGLKLPIEDENAQKHYHYYGVRNFIVAKVAGIY
jgi:hypothetical protein